MKQPQVKGKRLPPVRQNATPVEAITCRNRRRNRDHTPGHPGRSGHDGSEAEEAATAGRQQKKAAGRLPWRWQLTQRGWEQLVYAYSARTFRERGGENGGPPSAVRRERWPGFDRGDFSLDGDCFDMTRYEALGLGGPLKSSKKYIGVT